METKKAAVYARFSSDNQRDESIDAQLRACEEFARRQGLSIVKVYADRAKSATSDKRPEFQKMIADSAAGLFEAVIVHKLDRFSRDKYDSVNYKRRLRRNGVRLFSVTENLDGSPESVILESLLEGMAEYYSKNLAREVMKGMKENAYKCMHTGGLPPLGFNVDPATKRYVVNEPEAVTIRKIFDLYLEGYGYDRIITILNGRGYRTKIGRPFGKNSLHDILSNEKYCGTYVFNRSASKDPFGGGRNNHASKDGEDVIRVDGGVPALISKEDFEKVRQKMAANKRSPGSYKAKELYLLGGLVFCGECGLAMQGNHRHGGRGKLKYISYRCGNRDRTKTCDNKELRKEYIEEYVLCELERHIFNDEAIPYLVERLNRYQSARSAGDSSEAALLAAQLKEVAGQIENIVSAVAGGFKQQSFIDRLQELEGKKALLEARLKELELQRPEAAMTEETIRKLLARFKEHVAGRDLPEIKKFIGSYVQKVLIYKDRAEVVFNVAFCLGQSSSEGLFTSSAGTDALIKTYRKVVGM